MAEDLLEGIDGVPWESFPTPWAEVDPRPFDVAAELRALCGEDGAVAAVAGAELEELLVAGGGLAAAAPHAVPFLARILVDGRGEGRAQAGLLLAEIALLARGGEVSVQLACLAALRAVRPSLEGVRGEGAAASAARLVEGVLEGAGERGDDPLGDARLEALRAAIAAERRAEGPGRRSGLERAEVALWIARHRSGEAVGEDVPDRGRQLALSALRLAMAARRVDPALALELLETRAPPPVEGEEVQARGAALAAWTVGRSRLLADLGRLDEAAAAVATLPGDFATGKLLLRAADEELGAAIAPLLLRRITAPALGPRREALAARHAHRRGEPEELLRVTAALVDEWCGPSRPLAANQVLSRGAVAELVALLPEGEERERLEERLVAAPDPEIALAEDGER